MQIDVTELLEETGHSLHLEEEIDYKGHELQDGRAVLGSVVSVDVTLTHLSEGLLELTGTYAADLIVSCSRCLQDLSLELEEELLGLFIPENYEQDIEPREGRYRVEYTGSSVEFWRLIRQDFLVNIPMRPLCQDDCQGLCPECGANLNQNDCGHDLQPEVTDPRLEGLKDIDIESNQ